MSSPFSTIEEFNGAIDGPTEGAIYTFANTPIINTLALLVAVGIFIWFIAATYSTHVEPPSATVDKSLNRLSTFIVVGLLSLVAADHRQAVRPDRTVQASLQTSVQSPRRSLEQLAPFGLLGMLGIALPTRRRQKKQRRKRLAQGLSDYRSRR